ncbi:fibronectin type III domain-containing protein [Galbibacter sp. EGI 63066]|uniref:fibronectin type III domain-containing protein n=1 Tax=Galbibacter sp. EGI 63066 TaxID=2993559 RepID=UPI002248B0FE|nr:fibronectin type III domain-containing protein [Galbibacter sp. EGI 63066]MCX2679176.1 fibronectin type III domain-containing protein [Galbibacter sp. EGI 63066]
MKIKIQLSFLVIAFGVFSLNAQNLHTDANAASIDNEADATTGWIGGAVLSSVSDDPQNGTFALMAVSSGVSSGRNMEYTLNVVPGEVYNISIWAKRGEQSYSPAFANWSGFNGFSTTGITTENWTEYNFELTANANTATIRVYTSPTSRGDVSGDTVLIDGVSIIGANEDTEAPSAVTDLTASNTTFEGTTLDWTAATDNVGVTDYEVFQDGVSIGLTGGATTFAVSGLTPETNYAFTVFAMDAANNTSTVSNTANVTTLAESQPDTEAPSAVTDLTASNTTFEGTTLDWTAATDNVGVTDYEVFQDGVSIGLTGGATNFNVTGLTPETSYAFTVFAMDAANNTSAVSNTANVTTLAESQPDTEAPSAVTDLTASNTTFDGTSLSWTAATDNVGVTDYEVFQDGVSIGLTGGTTTFAVTGLTPETNYAFTVFAMDAANNTSAVSNTANVTTLEDSGNTVVDYTSENANLETVDWQANNMFVNGNMGIGTSSTLNYRLAVAGNIVAEEVRVALQGNWPDYVFESDYKLPSLDEVEKHIVENKHLINIPSANEIKEEGIRLGEMNAKLLRKIEELTLYILQQKKEINQLQRKNAKLESLTERIEKLESKINQNQ